jgi:hypothetical protein
VLARTLVRRVKDGLIEKGIGHFLCRSGQRMSPVTAKGYPGRTNFLVKHQPSPTETKGGDSAGTRPPFPHPAAVAAKFHFVPHALPFLPPREGASAACAGLLGKVLLLHAFHGGSAAGGCGSFISRSESR